MAKKPQHHHDHHHSHSAHTGELKRINRVKGQIEGIERMIKEHRYCPDIIIQVRAARAALKAVEASILGGHVRGCVTGAFHSKNKKDIDKKIEELVDIFIKNS